MKKNTVLVFSVLTGAVAAAGVVGRLLGEKLKKAQRMSDKHLALFLMMNQWVRVKLEGKNLYSYFEKNGYKRIAVYGMSYAGETLVDELKKMGIEVVYGIDQKAGSIYAGVEIVTLDSVLAPVDALVVTAITFFDEIEEVLRDKVCCPIISLEDILYEI